ncbi:MAG TPA: phospholipase D-like domain-containing protein, partial [Clostridia bacterium]|nr:phospholipase D-like domain-containing protein [Clostridia bacterium]
MASPFESLCDMLKIMRYIYYLAYILYLLLITFLIFFDQRKPMKRFGWILVLLFLPGLGLVLYWFSGSDSHTTYQKRRILQRHATVFNRLEEIVAIADRPFVEPASKGLRFHKEYCGSIFTNDNDIDIYTTGAGKYRQLFKDIEDAQDNIHIMYFTIHNDNTGKRLIDSLIKKVQQGIEVKLLYDSIGCLSALSLHLIRRLRKAGGSVHAIRPYTRNINYRNHRKIVIIDGKIGYFGGMNIGDQYRDGVRGKHWRDTHARVTGSIVHDLQRVFLFDLAASEKEANIGLRHELEHYFPSPDIKGNLQAQVVASGLYNNSNAEIMNLGYTNLIAQAEKRVWIQSPYFRPSDTLLNALKTSAALGVDVRLMVSLGYASFGVFNRSLNRFFLRQLTGTEVRVFGYKNLMHGKTMIIDDYGLCIGT